MDLLLWGRRWALVWILAACRGQTEEDEKRPYKFAFAIEGYQHRSEEKDERGIIMGEFGFVTGDGVYHVTVYATDENGNFKILKMKNFYIGLPGEGTTVAPSRAPPPTTRATTPSPPPTTKSPVIKHLEGLMGCSGCIVPNKNKNGGGAVGTTENYGAGLLDERFGGDGGGTTPGYGGRPGSTFGGRPGKPPGTSPGSFGGRPVSGGGGSGVYPGGVGGGGGGGSQGGKGGPSSYPGVGGGGVGGGLGSGGTGGSQGGGPGGLAGGGGSSRYPGTGATGSGGSGIGGGSGGGFPGQRPSGGSPGNPGVPGTSPVDPGTVPGSPNIANGLPPGMSMEDLMALLYKFNYTLKYHGHHESGYRNGDKEGGYFFNGRDGVGRNVKYIANEFGFQPNITLVDLGLQHPDTPTGESEENELRGNEFKWFYKK